MQGAANLIMAADAYQVSHEEKQLSHEIDLFNQSVMDPKSHQLEAEEEELSVWSDDCELDLLSLSYDKSWARFITSK